VLAELHGVRFEEVTVCAGADAVIGYVCQTALDPGDEVVTGWPSFPSYVLDPLKLSATPVRVPLRDQRFDLEGILDAITERTKLVFLAAPNNPTGTTNTRAELGAYFDAVPPHVLTVLDQAYFEYVDDPDYPDAIEEYAKAGRRVLVLRTFSKIYGLAGLRVGYGVGPAEVVTAIGKVRRAFDVTTAGQEAALASIGARSEIERRRSLNREAMTLLVEALRRAGFEPVEPAVANFVFVEVDDAAGLNDALLRRGVIVRPMGSFGAPNALRISAGTPDEISYLSETLDTVLSALR
jgi:histidinol-phosphate aminotransferase